jgi:WD40 repeat protein
MIGGKISLKFFELNEKKTYQLITAVDSPHTDKVNSILNHPNEDYFVSCSKDGFVKIWSFKNDSFICSGILSYRKLNPTSISFSKDGSLIAISFHNILTFWDLTELTMIHSMIHFHEIKYCFNCFNSIENVYSLMMIPLFSMIKKEFIFIQSRVQ